MSPPNKRTLVLTVDYEIFGNGTGDVRQHVTEPTERTCHIAEKFGMPVTVFFKMEEYLLFQQYREALQRLLGYDPAAEMRPRRPAAPASPVVRGRFCSRRMATPA